MIDAVLSYHLNPATCGVAKFNYQLAQKIGVPLMRWRTPVRSSHPLFSLKASEIAAGEWLAFLSHPPKPRSFDVLWHDAGRAEMSSLARNVFSAEALGCPSTIVGDASRGSYRVLAFGMAHKLVLPHFEQLKARLDCEHPDYTIELSTAVHEGSPWDEALTASADAMRRIFGDRLRVLGFLADDALARLLTEVDAVAAFYTPALRANNTTAWAALDAGKTLYTNRDDQSPTEPPTWERLLDILTASSNRVEDSVTVSTNTI